MAKISKASVGTKKRIWWFFIGFLLCMCIVIGRLGYLQLYKGSEYKEKAAEQQTQDRKVAAKRGNIYDRNMKVLAQSASCEDVMINPREIQSAMISWRRKRAEAEKDGKTFSEEPVEERIVKNLTKLLGVDEEFLRREMTSDYASRRIKRQVDQSVVNQIRALDLPGVFFESSTKRYYPYASLASHILGFTGTDGIGLEGLEKELNETLSGTPGRIQEVLDVHNNATPYKYENYIAPEEGRGVVLTIDEVLQHYVEKYLEEAYNLYDIRNGGAAILMNPNSGEILAMAVAPDYDLNTPRVVDEELKVSILGEYKENGEEYTDGEYFNKLWRNKAVVDTYEPGSTFKCIVAASAIESGAINPETFSCDCRGFKQVSVHTIHCHKKIGHGVENFYQALENSCNPAFMEMGDAMKQKTFREYFEAFGFTSTTNFLLPGESKGIFYSASNFNEAELATSSFGQGFQITPLQLITAFSAVVNGGNLMSPKLVKAYTDENGNVIETVEDQIVRQVISESTSRTMRIALEGVVSNGTGKSAYVEGYRIGGKTGTSEKFPREEGKKIASFIGFAPADDPQLVCLLILDEPGGTLTGGGAIAAPAVGKILSESLDYLGYEPQFIEIPEDEKIDVPSFVGSNIETAKANCKNLGFATTVNGNGDTVINQLPAAGEKMEKGGKVILYTETDTTIEVEVPDFTGLTKSQAEAKAKEVGLSVSAGGGGANNTITEDMLAIKQGTPPGSKVLAGSRIDVDFASNSHD